MDHSYSTEREKVQKTDHSYFTVAKKTPKVVLRKAQLMKEHQETSRSSIGQDHSYVRPDHVVRLTEVVTDETVYDRNDADVDTFIPHLPKNNAQMPPFGCIDNGNLCNVLRSSEMNPTSRIRSLTNRLPICFQEARLSGSDLDNIDTQISGIRLDHAYDLKTDNHRRSLPSSIRSKAPDPSSVVPCRDQLLRLRLHDHTYLGTKIVDKA